MGDIPVRRRAHGQARRGQRRGAPPRRAGSRGSQAAQQRRAPRHQLLLVSVGAVALGLLGVLFVNAILSQGAFRQHELEIELTLISEQEESLARKVQVDESPLTLERRAIALGMVPAESPVFLDLDKQRILGEPVPAPSPTVAVTIGPDELTAPPERLAGTLLVPEAPSPAASPAPVASPAASAGASAAATPVPASAPASGPSSGPSSAAPSPAEPSNPTASPAAGAGQ